MRKLKLLSLAFFPMLLFAQEATGEIKEKSGREFSINLGYHIGLDKGSFGLFTLQPEYGKHFNERFYFGGGTGLLVDDHFDAVSIPLFIRTEVDFPLNKITPYISLQGGYDLSVNGGTNWIRINPAVGFRTPISRTVAFNMNLGYTHVIPKHGKNLNFLGVNAGFSFDSSGKGFKKFLRKLDYNLELEANTPVKNRYKQDNRTSEDKYKGIIGGRISILGPMPLENLYAGVSLGAGRFKEEYTDDVDSPSQHDYYDDYSDVYISVMARARYKIKQLSITDRLYPFGQIDFGLCGFESHFSVNPTIGLSYMTTKKQSIDLSVGYSQFNGLSGMRLSLGYTF